MKPYCIKLCNWQLVDEEWRGKLLLRETYAQTLEMGVQGHCTGTGTEVATAWRMTKQKLQIARGALS